MREMLYIYVCEWLDLLLLGSILGSDGAGTRDNLPRDINNTIVKTSKLLESSRGQIDGLTDLTASTFVDNLNNNSLLLVLVVGDLHTFITVFELLHGLLKMRKRLVWCFDEFIMAALSYHGTDHTVNSSRVGRETNTIITSSVL